MRYLKTFERFKAPQNAQQYKNGEEIVFIDNYDDKLKRGAVFKITSVGDNFIKIEDSDKRIIADITFDGEVENYFKKRNPHNDQLDLDLLN